MLFTAMPVLYQIMAIKLCEAPLTLTESAGVDTSAQSDQIKLALLKQKCQ